MSLTTGSPAGPKSGSQGRCCALRLTGDFMERDEGSHSHDRRVSQLPTPFSHHLRADHDVVTGARCHAATRHSSTPRSRASSGQLQDIYRIIPTTAMFALHSPVFFEVPARHAAAYFDPRPFFVFWLDAQFASPLARTFQAYLA
mmetsp:Transcript_32644/g.107643  ORF Transcript_32644/g.107643 Transcript_32644/m.107643 type:complete len:144 (+) Transcript_32644:279-710(+)